MKPTAWIRNQGGKVELFLAKDLEANTPKEGSFSMTPLYTIPRGFTVVPTKPTEAPDDYEK